MAKKLTTNPFMGELNIHILRMKTGNDIICNILDCDENKSIVTIECPLDIDVTVVKGKKYISFAPWIPLEAVSENRCNLRSSDILTFFKPRMKLMLRYIELYWTINTSIEDSDSPESSDSIDKSSIN